MSSAHIRLRLTCKVNIFRFKIFNNIDKSSKNYLLQIFFALS